MLYVRALTPEEGRALRRLHQHGTFHLVQRAQIVLLSANGWSVPVIAQALKCCRRTVRAWIHAFHRGGVVQLSGKVLGRPLCSDAQLSATTLCQASSPSCEPSGSSRLVPVIPLTVPEVRRLLGELIWNRRRCAEFVLHWSAYRRYKQALAKRSHYLKRGAEPPQFPQLRL